jgi:hypothetical protein
MMAEKTNPSRLGYRLGSAGNFPLLAIVSDE